MRRFLAACLFLAPVAGGAQESRTVNAAEAWFLVDTRDGTCARSSLLLDGASTPQEAAARFSRGGRTYTVNLEGSRRSDGAGAGIEGGLGRTSEKPD
jgi:ABC-type phosphate transport system substrate-binding protein